MTELDEATLADDAALDAWSRAHLCTAIHMCGTAKMGPADSRGSVVDQSERVHGTQDLFVADTSILPDVPSRGPSYSAVIVGEFIADCIKGARLPVSPGASHLAP